MRVRLGVLALVMGAAVAWINMPRVEAVLPPYCTDGCSSIRPCSKECRDEGGTVITCGEFGLCEGGGGDPEPTPPPSPAPCNTVSFTANYYGGPPGQKITFYADTSTIVGPVNWDFGDATHCIQCGYTVDHTYNNSGTFSAVLTATVANCGQTRTSAPKTITIPITCTGGGCTGCTSENCTPVP